MALGRNLTLLLYDHKMTQAELAERIGVSPMMVSKIVLGKKTPSVQRLLKIAEVFNVTLDELVK